MTLWVPAISPDDDTFAAAKKYADSGFYVLPVRPGGKHAGSRLGEGWPSKSSKDIKQLAAWFAGSNDALALHCGRSGVVAFDVDTPAELPDVLRYAIEDCKPPYQATRDDDSGKGHYLFEVPPGRILGNGTGQLGRAWGDVRGRNGIIMLAPSPHPKPEGHYHWVRHGEVPLLPVDLSQALPNAPEMADAATDAEVMQFLATRVGNTRPDLMTAVVDRFDRLLAKGSRHGALAEVLPWAMRESAAGFYPAIPVVQLLQAKFVQAKTQARSPDDKVYTLQEARDEFLGLLAWSVGVAGLAPPQQTQAAVAQRLPEGPMPATALLMPQPSTLEAVVAAPLDPFEVEVGIEAHKLLVREEAARRVRQRAQPVVFPEIRDLVAVCAEPPDPIQYRVEGLWPTGGRVMLAAQAKAGKTTLVTNLVRSMVTGESFLGRYGVHRPGGPIVVLDFEMSGDTLNRWWRTQGIHESSRVGLVQLRGNVAAFDILNLEYRAEWARRLKAVNSAVVVLDCLGPALAAGGLDENSNADVGRFLASFDTLLKDSGTAEALVVHHMGHSGERSRGAARLGDWPDANWRLVLEPTENGDTDLTAPRYFSAFGRDVDEPETALVYDQITRRLTGGIGNRGEGRLLRLVEDVIAYVTEHEGCSQNDIENAVGGKATLIREACKLAVRQNRIWVESGPSRSKRHWLTRGGSNLKPLDQMEAA